AQPGAGAGRGPHPRHLHRAAGRGRLPVTPRERPAVRSACPLNLHASCGYIDPTSQWRDANKDDGEVSVSLTAEETPVRGSNGASWLWRRQVEAYTNTRPRMVHPAS